jgi:hypothetical protein
LEYRISWRILPIPPTPAVFDQRVVEVHPCMVELAQGLINLLRLVALVLIETAEAISGKDIP